MGKIVGPKGALLLFAVFCCVYVSATESSPAEERWDEDFETPPPTLHTSRTQDYAGHSVVRFALESTAAKAAFDKAVKHHGIDVWDEVPGSHAVARVPPTVLLASIAVPHTVLNHDLEAALIQERTDSKIGFHGKYHTVDEIHSRLQALAHANANLVSLETLAHTAEGRPVQVLHIKAQGAAQAQAPIVFIQAGQHAREWIAPAAALYALDQFIAVAKQQGGLPGYQLSLVALMNPDGYHHTVTKDRMWRKNRAVLAKDKQALQLLEASADEYDKKQCKGVDLNRNWATHWAKTNHDGTIRSDSTSECRDTFQGLAAEAEPEVAGVTAHVLAAAPRVAAFLDIHSYSEKLLPPGCNGWAPSKVDAAVHAEVGAAVVTTMNSVAGGSYKTGPCISDMYQCSGTAGDWAFQHAKIRHSYSLELRPTNAIQTAPRDKDGNLPNGFVVAPTEISPTGKELAAGITALAEQATK